MEFYQVMENRKSVKSFSSQNVPQNKVDNIINAARLAPSWKNNQCWKFVLVKDKTTIKALAQAVGSDNTAQKGVEEAPLVVVVCAEPNKSADINNKELYLVDTAIAMEHLILAAENEGLGTCWVAKFNEEEIRRTLVVPENFRIVALTPVGFADEKADVEARRPINEVVFQEKWGNYVH